ncbi:hypothetical protein A9Q99_01155 [Gammaproteobacteria bacterium 45_16_T64]|nr:hypothetical protein A9Q99_01155 [Gammaproteobacteria bacterium 45_16_T64]
MDVTPFERPLSEEAAREAREQILSLVLDLIKQVSETEEGYLFDFGRNDEATWLACQLIEVERKVNPFLRMHLVSESHNGPVKLEIVGPSGTKSFLHSEFGLSRWFSPS